MPSPTMPALFIAHGTPINALQSNQFTQSWCQLNQTTPTPKAILCISAHWVTNGCYVTSQDAPPTIHDFGGFPQALFDCQYTCPGSLELAEQLQQLIGARLTQNWGLDHGCWSVLKHLYPSADIPVVQLSIDNNKSPQQHYDFAKQLQALRNQGVLIIGSGNIVHNIGKWMSAPNGPIDWAKVFNEIIVSALNSNDHQAVIEYQQHRYAKDAVPTLEHYAPLLYIIALQQQDEAICFSQFGEQTLETCSMTSIRIG